MSGSGTGMQMLLSTDTLCAALNATIWRQESPGPGEAESRAPRTVSVLLHPPILFALPSSVATSRGSAHLCSSAAHLVFFLRRGDVMVMYLNMMDTTVSRQCLTHENDATLTIQGAGRRVLCLASLHFCPMELPSFWLPGWVYAARGAQTALALTPYERLLPGECCWHPEWESEAACSQQKIELMTFSSLISSEFRHLVLTVEKTWSFIQYLMLNRGLVSTGILV